MLEYESDGSAQTPITNRMTEILIEADDQLLQFGSEIYEMELNKFVDLTGPYVIDTTASLDGSGGLTEKFFAFGVVFGIFAIILVVIALMP